jgi:hypothetical protein
MSGPYMTWLNANPKELAQHLEKPEVQRLIIETVGEETVGEAE